jgi:hypothetical protein
MHLTDADAIDVAGGLFLPVRRELGIHSFGVNAYIAREAGDQLIETHDETGSGSGGQEELYVVVRGRATFVVGGEEIDAPAGTLVFVSDVSAKRSATAAEAGTVALVVGAPADRRLPVSPFEYWFVAEKPYRAGDYRSAIELASAGLEEWPDHPHLHYQLACYHALDGNAGAALDHLARACTGDPEVREWARGDEDFDSIRSMPEFAEITS